MDSWGIVDSTGDGMLVLDEQGTIRFANPAARRMFGRDIEGASLGVPLAPNGTVEVGIHGPLGVEGYAEMRLTPLSWQGQSATLASLRDVTDRERVRRELQDEKDFFAALMENLGALVLIMSPTLVIERVNRACREACGLPASQMVGRPLVEVFPDLGACIVKQSPPLECETDWDGCIVAWRLTAFGQHLVCTGYDISERRRAQRLLEQRNFELDEARRQAEGGSRAKTEFLAMMSHELRTPMSAVLGMLELLSESPLENRQRDYVRLADTGARELLGVLDDILDISKIEAGHIKIRPLPFSLPRALERLVGVLQVEAQRGLCNLHLDCPGDLPELVVGDWGRLRQILLNLLGNALKFCDDDCGLRVRLVDGAPLHTFHFAVWDTGDGIHPDDQERIFKPFIQVDGTLSRTHEGTGLGLAIAASLVKRMGGSLAVDSELGRGSTFRFQLTLPPAEEQEPPEQPDLPRPSEVRILLVDDNPISRRVAVLMLENWGYSVEAVDSGQEALERLETRAHDVVLLDIQMPGLSGYDVLEKLRQSERARGQSSIPVVALTAHCVVGEQERALEAGMDGFLTKPVDRTLLHQTLARLFPDPQ
jgi:signal transduction histidine kinase/CheY-like chemotaxis protein